MSKAIDAAAREAGPRAAFMPVALARTMMERAKASVTRTAHALAAVVDATRSGRTDEAAPHRGHALVTWTKVQLDRLHRPDTVCSQGRATRSRWPQRATLQPRAHCFDVLFNFTGKIDKVTCNLGDEVLTAVERKALHKALARKRDAL